MSSAHKHTAKNCPCPKVLFVVPEIRKTSIIHIHFLFRLRWTIGGFSTYFFRNARAVRRTSLRKVWRIVKLFIHALDHTAESFLVDVLVPLNNCVYNRSVFHKSKEKILQRYTKLKAFPASLDGLLGTPTFSPSTTTLSLSHAALPLLLTVLVTRRRQRLLLFLHRSHRRGVRVRR